MTKLVILLDSKDAVNAEILGPKAANQAALGHAGLPIPDGFCLSSQAYRMQLNANGLEEVIARLPSADIREARLITNEIRIGLFDKPIAHEILDPVAGNARCGRGLVARNGTAVRRGRVVKNVGPASAT